MVHRRFASGRRLISQLVFLARKQVDKKYLETSRHPGARDSRLEHVYRLDKYLTLEEVKIPEILKRIEKTGKLSPFPKDEAEFLFSLGIEWCQWDPDMFFPNSARTPRTNRTHVQDENGRSAHDCKNHSDRKNSRQTYDTVDSKPHIIYPPEHATLRRRPLGRDELGFTEHVKIASRYLKSCKPHGRHPGGDFRCFDKLAASNSTTTK